MSTLERSAPLDCHGATVPAIFQPISNVCPHHTFLMEMAGFRAAQCRPNAAPAPALSGPFDALRMLYYYFCMPDFIFVFCLFGRVSIFVGAKMYILVDVHLFARRCEIEYFRCDVSTYLIFRVLPCDILEGRIRLC